MKNLMKGISLMVVFLSFQSLATAAEVAAVPTDVQQAIADTKTEEEKKAEELKLAAGEVAAIPATETAHAH